MRVRKEELVRIRDKLRSVKVDIDQALIHIEYILGFEDDDGDNQ